ncbi:hypothetical protein JTB14_022890 [Gonioctena quinquepunctata]|nr:hypothetical protein JTB14_022890 [Gonioctena quinquepunctata]
MKPFIYFLLLRVLELLNMQNDNGNKRVALPYAHETGRSFRSLNLDPKGESDALWSHGSAKGIEDRCCLDLGQLKRPRDEEV